VIHGVISTQHDQKLILPHVMKTSSVMERMQGLLYRAPLNIDEGLIIQPCSSIHTIGMHYDIDVVFLTKDLVIKKIIHHLKPWRCSMSFGAAMVLEMIAGNTKRLGLEESMNLIWEPNK
jgi:uncharacterized protein